MKTLVTALASLLPQSGASREIVFIPEGKNTITPQSHPKGITVNLPAERGVEIAARFQSELEDRLRKNVKPWTDFEHSRKYPASGYPVSFRYQQGAGLMLSIDWSGSGKKAIEDKDVLYFSPEFYVDSDGTPNGLPTRGPLGGLVTEPAFRGMPTIAASLPGIAHPFQTAAQRLVDSGKAKDLTQAFTMVAVSHPHLYADYHESLVSGSEEQSRIPEKERHEDPLAELLARADQFLTSGRANSADAALVMAAVENPELYDDYRDSFGDGRAEKSVQKICAVTYADPVAELEKRANQFLSCGHVSDFGQGMLRAAREDSALYECYARTLIGSAQ